MNIFQQLTEKSWEKQGVAVEPDGGPTTVLPTAKLGLRVFLAVATVVFSLIVIVYADRMTIADWRPFPEPLVLWLNTALLILSSVALQLARNGADRDQVEEVRVGLLAGGGFAFAFLIGQYYAWLEMVDAGYFAATNPANAFFYLITAMHALHLLGGLVAWGRTVAKLWGGVEVGKLRLSVELCTVYWHFLLVVWLILFGLLLFT